MQPETTPLPIRFGKYTLQEFLGGGMSRVYRATDAVLGRTVAIKIHPGTDLEERQRFLIEATTTSFKYSTSAR
jgi:serine/threonine protein kinase